MSAKMVAAGCGDHHVARTSRDGRPNHRRQASSGGCTTTTFHEAVDWFKELGYAIEPGPGIDEVTLINDRRPDFIAHHMVPVEKLAGMAHLSQIVRAQQIFRPHSMAMPHLLQGRRRPSACPSSH